MKRARIGKIARLPLNVRTQLNQRLQDGQSGKMILDWVNRMEVWVSDELCERAAITEQNLSEWRAGGYEDWLKHEEAKEWVQRLAEQGKELAETAEGGIADQFAAYVAVEMTRVAKVLLERETDVEKRWDRLCEVAEKLSRLRRDDHRAEQTRTLRRKAKEAKQREGEAVQEKHDARKMQLREAKVWAPQYLVSTAKMHGGGVEARRFAARVVEMKYDLREGHLDWFVGETKVSPAGRGEDDLTEGNEGNKGDKAKLVDCPSSPRPSPPRRGGNVRRVLEKTCICLYLIKPS